MPSQIKELMLKEYVDSFTGSAGFLLTELKGLTVDESNNMRRELEKANADCKILKNRLLKITFSECKIEGMDDLLTGSTAAVIAQKDVVSVAKILVKYQKELDPVKIKGGYLDGQVLDSKGVLELSKIPSREELLSKLLGSLQSPIVGLVSVLNGVQRNFVGVLSAIKDKKEKE